MAQWAPGLIQTRRCVIPWLAKGLVAQTVDLSSTPQFLSCNRTQLYFQVNFRRVHAHFWPPMKFLAPSTPHLCYPLTRILWSFASCSNLSLFLSYCVITFAPHLTSYLVKVFCFHHPCYGCLSVRLDVTLQIIAQRKEVLEWLVYRYPLLDAQV